MTEPQKPKGFNIKRYPKNLRPYFPKSWGGLGGEHVKNHVNAMLRREPMPEADGEELSGQRRVLAALGLSPSQLIRARMNGMPFKQDSRRHYWYHLPTCQRWLEQNFVLVI